MYMLRHKTLAAAVAVAGSLAVAGAATAAPPTDTSALREAVTVAGSREHMAALEAIANANVFEGVPTRATGTPGHEASVEYVVGDDGGGRFNVTLQPFEADIFFEQAPAAFEQVAPDPTSTLATTARTASGTPPTSRATVTSPPRRWWSTSPSRRRRRAHRAPAARPADFDGPEVTGKIVLLQRGTCDFGLKAELAGEAGAVGAVIFNEGTIGAADRNDVLIPTLAGYDVTIPVVGTDYATGRALVDDRRRRPSTLRVKVDGFVDQDVQTNNVIAETPGGRADRTVVVGGHLDSVYEGPGINDDGSGVSMMLETAEQMKELGHHARATRCDSSSSAARSRACSARTTTCRSCRSGRSRTSP